MVSCAARVIRGAVICPPAADVIHGHLLRVIYGHLRFARHSRGCHLSACGGRHSVVICCASLMVSCAARVIDPPAADVIHGHLLRVIYGQLRCARH